MHSSLLGVLCALCGKIFGPMSGPAHPKYSLEKKVSIQVDSLFILVRESNGKKEI